MLSIFELQIPIIWKWEYKHIEYSYRKQYVDHSTNCSVKIAT